MDGKYDLVLKNGRIIDGTGNPSFVADVGIANDRIVKIGPIPGGSEEEIDLGMKVVAPGFIDLHNHCDHNAQAFPDVENYIMQGVTTSLGGNCGISMMPLEKGSTDLAKKYLSPFLSPECDYGWEWKNLGGFAEKVNQTGIVQNMGFLLGHGTIRIAAKGFDSGPASPDEIKTMQALMAQGMAEGAFGLSAGLIYSPGSYASTEEMTEIASVLKEYGGFFSIHVRNESNRLIESIEEALAIAEGSGASLEISHLKAGGRPNWGKVHGVLAILEEARERGVNVTCDAYPYTAGMTTITALLPPWALEGGVDRMLHRLSEPKDRQTIARDLNGSGADFENWVKSIGFDNIRIAACPTKRSYEGMSLREITAERKTEPFEAFFDWLLEVECNATMILFSLLEDDVEAVLRHPLTSVVSDGWITSPKAGGRPHPRGYGTFPRFLGRYVRERRLLRLEEAVRKITSLPARVMGLKDRGIVREGFKADLVVFDPDTIRDKATFDDPHQFPEGIDLVVVNGKVVVRKSKLTGNRPGTVLKK